MGIFSRPLCNGCRWYQQHSSLLNYTITSRSQYKSRPPMLVHQPTPHSIKATPQALYTGLLNTIPQHSSSYIHTHFTNIAIQKLSPNTILGTSPLKYITQNTHYHVQTEYTLAGFIADITLLWQLTKREYKTLLRKSAYTVAITPTASHT